MLQEHLSSNLNNDATLPPNFEYRSPFPTPGPLRWPLNRATRPREQESIVPGLDAVAGQRQEHVLSPPQDENEGQALEACQGPRAGNSFSIPS